MRVSAGLMLARAVMVCGAAVIGGAYMATQKPALAPTEKATKEKPVHKSVKRARSDKGDEEESDAKGSAEEPEKRPQSQNGAIRDAIAKLLKGEDGALFPQGTKITGATLDDGLATLAFSGEFQQMEAMGESTEAEAQKAIIGALARFPVEKARIIVDGKPYSSAVVDWSEPFTVQ